MYNLNQSKVYFVITLIMVYDWGPYSGLRQDRSFKIENIVTGRKLLIPVS